MEQIYMIEIFIDKVTIFLTEEDKSSANKKLIIKIKFGPKVQFIIKEGQLAVNEDAKDDIVECDEFGRRKWSRTIRVGKSYLFPSYPDTVLMVLSKFPLEIEVWNDDEQEIEIFVGIGTMCWHTEFYTMLKDTTAVNILHEPLSIKSITPLFAECCCRQCGEISFIFRLSALGDSIITEFQQLMKDPDSFVFRTNKAPSMFQCTRVEGTNPNFCMVGSLYETTTLEDPVMIENAQRKIEVCTELQSCGVGKKDEDYKCMHESEPEPPRKSYPISTIRMGDISGPCGNTNCPLAHKIKTYIRNLDAYKREANNKEPSNDKGVELKKVCGKCSCKDDRWHREECPEIQKLEGKQGKELCSGCGGLAQVGETCGKRRDKLYGTGTTPKGSVTNVAYIFNVTQVPNFMESIYGPNYAQNNNEPINSPVQQNNIGGGCGCGCFNMSSIRQQEINVRHISAPRVALSNRSFANESVVYNVDETKRKIAVLNCTETKEDDCKCSPIKPSPPCGTFDCDCIAEIGNIKARKTHKPYCPLYKHKANCPVTMMNEEEVVKKQDDEEDDNEPLPYGLPPIKLGPCLVLGRPCTVPDGFARMYKTGALAALPPSYSDAGKVCCSKEYERIKKAITEYMKNEKDDDFRCINRFNVDTETRCCDKEQRLFSLMGRECCGSHKLAIQEKYKQDN